MILIRLLAILLFATSSNATSITQEEPHRNSWKIQKIDKPMRFPNDIPFFDQDNKKNYIEEFEDKTLLVVFWATWCAPCHKEMLELDILKKDFRKLPLEILPISQDYQGLNIVKDFYVKNEIRYLPIYHDYRNELFRELEVAGLPTCYIIDSEGLIKAIITGTISWHDENLRKMLLEYIDGNPVMPKNSYKNNSLNQPAKPLKEVSKAETENEEKREIPESASTEKIDTTQINKEIEKNDPKNDRK